MTDQPEPEAPPHPLAAAQAQVARLVAAEIALARAEVAVALRHAMAGLGLLAAAVILGLAAAVVLAQALVFGLAALGLPLPAAALVAGLTLVAAAGLAALAARQRLWSVNPLPVRALANLWRDAKTLFGQESSDARPHT